MDNEVLEDNNIDNGVLAELKNIGRQLEKIAKLLEESKSAPAKRGFGFDKKPFNRDGGRGFGRGGNFRSDRGDRGDRGDRENRFNADGKPRVIADGRKYDSRRSRY